MFKIGDKIVYPMHGAGIIDSVETKEFLGEEKEYFILKMPIGNMDISIPKVNINKMKIRDVISKKEGEEILAILEENPKQLNSNWNLRYRQNQEILKTGDIFKIANMVSRFALPPLITMLAQSFGFMIAGSSMVESVFSIPGLGSMLVTALNARDTITINACVLLTAVIFVLVNFLADCLNTLLNPQSQMGGRS